MEEYVYFNENGLEFPISETIKVVTNLEEIDNSNFIVSNSKNVKSEVIAPEIDFYIKNSKDSFSNKIQNVQRLYEINAVRFDYAEDISYTQEVSNKLLLVGDKQQSKEFLEKLQDNEFDVWNVTSDIIKSISGHIGNLSVVVEGSNDDVTLKVDQIVWHDSTQLGHDQSGTFDPNETSIDNVLETIRANVEKYEYKKFTTYDSNICQYHERREETCGKCEEVCPSVAIVKVDEKKHLEFSQIDCHGCGGCISVCPAGALDYAPTNRYSLFELSKLYQGSIPLVIPAKMDIENLEVELKENILPFAIEGEKFLHESSMLTLLQESGSSIIFYSDFLSKGTKDTIQILNDIYEKRYNKKAIYLAMNKEELIDAIAQVDFIEDSRYTINQVNTKKREIFSLRLKYIVGDQDYGTVNTGEHIHYGKINVKEDNCTLCLSCVAACNVDALVANVSDNSLRINPSVCTSCGYCLASCPEKDCISLEEDVIELNPDWFTEQFLAKDTLFACVECGKEFATTKAVEKIAKMMAPIFASDPIKERTLYCCETCKPKIMMQSYRQNPQSYKNKQGVI